MSLRPFLCNPIYKQLKKHSLKNYISVCLASSSVQEKQKPGQLRKQKKSDTLIFGSAARKTIT
jgi:hypothetical protein